MHSEQGAVHAVLLLQQQLQHFTGLAFCALATLCKLPSNALLTRNMHCIAHSLPCHPKAFHGHHATMTQYPQINLHSQRGHASIRTWLQQVPPKMR